MNRVLVFLALCFLQLGAALAATNDVDVTLRAFRVVGNAGAVQLVPTTEVKPGDTIEYQVTYKNQAKTAARQVQAILPVPEGGMAYLAASALPASAQASLDGTTYGALPLMREIMRDGRRQKEPVPVSEYRFLRWELGDLRPGQAVTVTSRMRLDGAPTAATTRKGSTR